MYSRDDVKWMRRALSLARRGLGSTSPNPMVGAVIVNNGSLAGSGYHKKAGEAHAEVNAIADAGVLCRKSTLYVTLEPCCTFGRTPPCTDAILKAGISKVVIGCTDPNPLHAGKGIEILKNAGLEVVCGVEEEQCRRLNEAFFKWISTSMPFVLLKLAVTLDGHIATASGESRWITGEIARKRVQKLRMWADAVMVGGETVRKDKPSLTVREYPCAKQPRRLVASRKMTKDELALYMTGETPEIVAPDSKDAWLSLLQRLGAEKVTSLLIEGGGELAASALAAGIVDKVEMHMAPKILGGKNSRPCVGGPDPDSLNSALNLKDTTVFRLGQDICISGYL